MKKFALIMASVVLLTACETEEILEPSDEISRRSVQIVNNRNSPMVIFRGSTIKETSWGPDRLGHRIIFLGQAVTLSFNDSSLCLYDFRAEFDDGAEVDERKFNICETSQWIAN